MVKIYLDDCRKPIEDGWILVKNYTEFVALVRKTKLVDISIISFDHDLGEDEAIALRSKGLSKRQSRAHKRTVKSGHDCAKYLIDLCMANEYANTPTIWVHSYNDVGVENILSLINNYKGFCDKINGTSYSNEPAIVHRIDYINLKEYPDL